MPDTPVHLTTQYGYFTTYDALNGTSMATPHVAGLAGLVWATGKCATNTCVRQRIETNADPIPGTGRYWYWGSDQRLPRGQRPLNVPRSLPSPDMGLAARSGRQPPFFTTQAFGRLSGAL